MSGVPARQCRTMAGMPVMNACVLDYLFKHPELISEEWKGNCIFFWGSIYLFKRRRLYVRYLEWYGGQWNWDDGWLYNDWDGSSPALLAYSSSGRK